MKKIFSSLFLILTILIPNISLCESTTLVHSFWVGHHWPTYKGGLNGNRKEIKDFKTLSKNKTKLSTLYPMQKYELIVNDLKFEKSRLEYDKITSFFEFWWGYCDGLAIASVTTKEPESKTFETILGEVTLSSEELKGLLSYYAAEKYKVKKNWGTQEVDITALEFHQMIEAIQIEPDILIFDLWQGHYVNNFPVLSFTIEKTNLDYTVTLEFAGRAGDKRKTFFREYKYRLINSERAIWQSKGPGMVWIPEELTIEGKMGDFLREYLN